MLAGLASDTIFQQDGAPPQCRITVRQLLDEEMPGSWMGRKGLIPWTARFPDLAPLGFFLCGYVNDKIYQAPCLNLTQLIRRTTYAIRTVNGDMLRNILKNNKTRINTVA